jgi:hypothetical protein
VIQLNDNSEKLYINNSKNSKNSKNSDNSIIFCLKFNMKIITLNTWGGRAGDVMIEFFKKYSDKEIGHGLIWLRQNKEILKI